MADLKISQLTSASTPLAGTEVLPIVQSGSTVKVSVANLTAGRAVGMAGGSFTDNITQSTAAKGINFTANTGAAGKTSQLLNWYEEGTWTATISDGTTDATMGVSTCQYTRVGRQVTVCGYISTSDITGITGNLIIKGLPFTIKDGLSYYSGGNVGTCGGLNITANQVVSIYGVVNTTTIDIRLWDATTGTTGLTPAEWSDDGNMVFSMTYFA